MVDINEQEIKSLTTTNNRRKQEMETRRDDISKVDAQIKDLKRQLMILEEHKSEMLTQLRSLLSIITESDSKLEQLQIENKLKRG